MAFWLGLASLVFPGSVRGQAKPNFIFILVDDLGWMDLSVQGSTFYETPNIDAMARDGMRFTEAYAGSPVCSPTRAALMTGKDAGRTRITDWIPGTAAGSQPLGATPFTHYLPLGETTLAEALRQAGYQTASIGKWHLGEADSSWPMRQGFDTNIGGYNAGHPASYFPPYRNPTLKDGPEGEYLTDRLTDEAIRWIEAHRTRPFFLYLPHYGVHDPLQAKPAVIEKYRQKAAKLPPLAGGAFETEIRGGRVKRRQDNPAYAAMIESLDGNVGRLLDRLRALGLDSNTVVVFYTDNGGLALNPTSNRPLRAGKGWLFEGGIRVPFIVRWPGKIKAGTITRGIASIADIYPTFLEAAGAPLKPQQHLDGQSLLASWLGGKPPSRKALHVHFPHYHGGNPGVVPGGAIRFGDYKLIEWFEDNSYMLFNLRKDSSESTDLSRSEPDLANLLRWKLHRWRDSVKANMPANWKPSADQPVKPNLLGCTNPASANYDLYATVDDGTCAPVSPSRFPPIRALPVAWSRVGRALHVEIREPGARLRLFDFVGNSIRELRTGSSTSRAADWELPGPGIYWLEVRSPSRSGMERLVWH